MTPPTLLQRAIRQRRPFQSTAHEATVAILHTADLVRRRMSEVVEAEDITLQQFNVLRILRGGGEAGVATLEVAGRMVEQAPGITRLLDRLELKDLVRRQRCPKDRRQHLCWITAKGLAVLGRLDPLTTAAAERCMEPLNRADQATLIRLLALIRDAGPASAR